MSRVLNSGKAVGHYSQVVGGHCGQGKLGPSPTHYFYNYTIIICKPEKSNILFCFVFYL